MIAYALMIFIYNNFGGMTSQVLFFHSENECIKTHAIVAKNKSVSTIGCAKVLK